MKVFCHGPTFFKHKLEVKSVYQTSFYRFHMFLIFVVRSIFMAPNIKQVKQVLCILLFVLTLKKTLLLREEELYLFPIFQVFDAVIVLVSFSLDVYYIKGLTNYPVESFVLILTIMIPWRVIRVLNSKYEDMYV